jgi:hemolysin activation/secretion protein
MLRRFWKTGLLTIGLGAISPAAAQVPLDRADPTIVEQQLPTAPARRAMTTPTLSVDARPAEADLRAPITGMLRAISIEGRDQLPAAVFSDVIAGVVGRDLTRADLRRFADDVGGIARGRGYPFATASINAQPIVAGIMRVTLDLGRVDAVRVIGARNAQADRLLQANLVTGHGIRRGELERALLLVSDIAGVRVTETHYMRQDGFGILLVTIGQDRAQGYVQLDNRGSREIGPIRSTMLASVRGVASSGDELALIASRTPLHPSQFVFVRARYSAPVDAHGSIVSASASYGRSHPGGSLSRLDVRGESVDLAATYARPLIRTRNQSLWGTLEFHSISIDQTLAGRPLRRDRLTTLSAALNGNRLVAGGVLRGELAGIAGLPFKGVTGSGDPLASRLDGSGRFFDASYLLEWSRPIAGPISAALASAGQIADRPLLATAEIGLGGPLFGRAYDYAERTGDKGVMGSAELRADLRHVLPTIFNRAQVYGFADGGSVGDLRRSPGDGSLASSGAGIRLGRGKLDAAVEVAFPLTGERFDTRDQSPRVSARVSILL